MLNFLALKKDYFNKALTTQRSEKDGHDITNKVISLGMLSHFPQKYFLLTVALFRHIDTVFGNLYYQVMITNDGLT